MDVNCFQNLMSIQTPVPSASQSVSNKRPGQETRSFAAKLENAVTAKPSVSQNNIHQDIIAKEVNQANEKDGLEKQALENGIGALEEKAVAKNKAGDLNTPEPKEPLENVVLVPQTLPQANIAITPDSGMTEQQPNLPEDNGIDLTLRENQSDGGKNVFVFGTDNSAKEQIITEFLVPKGGESATSDQDMASISQNGEKSFQNTNTLADQTELLKNAAEDSKTARPTLESGLAKTVQLSPKALEINTEKQIISQVIIPDDGPEASHTINLTEKNSSDFNHRQDQAEQQFQFDKNPSLNAEDGKAQNTDQTANSNAMFTVPADNPTVTGKADSAANPGQPTPNSAPPQDQFQIRAQIVDQAVLINRGNQESEMLIRLKPEHLGELTLKVTVNNGVVNANFHSNNSEVRGLLEASLHQLKQDLANAGFKVDSVSISAGLSQFAAEQDRELNWQRQASRTSGKNGNNGYVEGIDAQILSRTGVNLSKDDGVDYLI